MIDGDPSDEKKLQKAFFSSRVPHIYVVIFMQNEMYRKF